MDVFRQTRKRRASSTDSTEVPLPKLQPVYDSIVTASPTTNSMSPHAEAIRTAEIDFGQDEHVNDPPETNDTEMAVQNVQVLSGNPMLGEMPMHQIVSLPRGDQEQERVQRRRPRVAIVSAHDICVN